MTRATEEAVLPRIPAEALSAALAAAAGSGEQEPLESLLRANSNLPGPRGNLELAAQFTEAIGALAAGGRAGEAWEVVAHLAAIGPREAPTGDPGEFLAFCGTVAAGALAAVPGRWAGAWEIIRQAATDERWRLREAAAQAIQRALPADPAAGLGLLGDWAAAGSWLLCRAVAAGLADPPLLHDPEVAAAALRLHELILERLAGAADRGDGGFKVMRRGLGYSLSVVVAAAPEPGFALLRRLATRRDPDLLRVLRANLGKGRLARRHAGEVEALRALLG